MVALHLWLVWVGPLPGDTWALRRGWYPHSAAIEGYADGFGELGTPAAAILILLAGLWVLVARRLLWEAVGLVVAYFVIPFNAILKIVLGPSPLWAEFHRGSLNYPSGHVTFVTGVIGYLGLISWRQGYRWPTVCAAVVVVGIGPARVVTGVHLVSDVVSGYLVGACFLILGYICTQPRTIGPGVDATTTPEGSRDAIPSAG